MNLQFINYFLALAKVRNFTRAAEEVHVVQSTFSAGIKKLEEILSAQLFERDKRNVKLTAKGEALIPKAKELMQKWQEIEELYNPSENFDLTLGFVQNISVDAVLPIVNKYKTEYLSARVIIEEDKKEILLKRLLNDHIHAFFTEDFPLNDPDLQFFKITSEDLYFAIHHAHPLAKKKSLALKELHNQPLIERSHCALYEDVFKQFDEQKITPKMVFAAHNNETVAALISSEMGMTLMPKPLFSIPEIKFIPIQDIQLTRKIILVTKNKGLSKSLKSLIETVKHLEKN